MAAKPAGANALAFIFITVLINMIGFGVVMPVMPQLIMDVTGEDLSHAARWGGRLTLVYAVMQFFMSPVMGALSDRFGRRPVVLGSLAAYSVDFLLMALAPTIGFLLLARILAGALAATFSTANAFIADISPPEKRAANFGLMGAAFGLGFIIGPALGGIIGDALGPRAPFFAVAGLGFCNLVYGFLFLPESLKPENRRAFEWRRANALGNFLHFRQYPALLPIAGAIFLYQVGHWTFPSVWAYYAEARFDWSPRDIGFSLMAVGLAAAIVQGGLARLVIPAIGERAAALFGLAVAVVIYAAYGLVNEGWMVYVLIPIGALAGFTLPALQGIMSRTLPADSQGELQGALGSIMGVSMIVGPYLMTQVFAAFNEPGEPFEIAGITILPQGAPVRLPGASFLLASLLALAAILPLLGAFGNIRRPRAGTATQKAAPERAPAAGE
ncbi:TCR/Tet family MFS transporter [Amphiplicatus metriothermophilus]|uniref:MFS transporter, DHA1 family, tetracycline resistance protein n=1 Tax=Amphiplicatus metriothermophilus TaxID=1519374 RepID=A0A239PVK3_9PROT|nr:TCR/Tet family MFS transporter [Amphiplicatus metriothermophilus]MBB5519723.1 DHA1 family tetracycline resistance protein-like MFS transporter [Amphiplicatus metriothermophilus]SNT74285.1 MFS transporter, DHA1 family, tetracycline resistance protein [Amphiplicatus metriothermophilus]